MQSFRLIDKLNPDDLSGLSGNNGNIVNVSDFEDVFVQFCGDFGGAQFDVVGRLSSDVPSFSKLFTVSEPGIYRVVWANGEISTIVTVAGTPNDVTGWIGGRPLR